MNYQHNFSLKNYNTFGIEASAQSFIEVTSEQELAQVLKENQDIFVLGGGSNMLLTQNIEKLVVHVNLKGIEVVQEDEDFVWVKETLAKIGTNLYNGVLQKTLVVSKIYR